MRFRNIALLLILPFIGGALLAGWAIKQYNLFGTDTPATAIVDVVKKAEAPVAPPVALPLTPPAPTEGNAAMTPGNSARTEGMLIANAARRAIDAGQPLDYIDDQLRLRFGGSQPQNVAILLNVGARPITLTSLQTGLDTIGDGLLSRSDDNGLLSRIQHEMSELIVLRKEGRLSTAPSQRLARAKQYAANGNIAAAISEVQKMPGSTRGLDWLTKAGNYVAAHKALDAIERAAATAPEALPPPPTLLPSLEQATAVPALETPILQTPVE